MHIALPDNISLLGIDDGFLHTMSIFTNLLRWVIPIKSNAVQTKQYYMPSFCVQKYRYRPDWYNIYILHRF